MLPLGLGRPEELLELEEMLEEPKQLKPDIREEPSLELEEEEHEEGEAVERTGTVQVQTMKIGEHEVVEEIVEGEDVSYLKCVRCGMTVRLDEVSKLSETKCIETQVVTKTVTESKTVELKTCGYCGGEAIGLYPVEYVDNNPIEVPVCGQCAGKIEETYLKARPNMTGLTRKARVRCRHPLEASRKVAWHHYTATWYVGDEKGRWPCPACGAVFDRILEAVKHFTEKHPELPARSGREYIIGVGEVSRTWQGYYCPTCGLLCESEVALKEHYKTHGGG